MVSLLTSIPISVLLNWLYNPNLGMKLKCCSMFDSIGLTHLHQATFFTVEPPNTAQFLFAHTPLLGFLLMLGSVFAKTMLVGISSTHTHTFIYILNLSSQVPTFD